MKLAHERQVELLRLQDLETEVIQVRRRIRSSPAVQRVDQLEQKIQDLKAELVRTRTESEDLARAIRRAEEDVGRLRERKRHDEKMLDSGVSAKVQRELAHESQALDRRIKDMEDAELELLEVQENATKKMEDLKADLSTTEEQRGVAEEDRDSELAELTQQRNDLEAQVQGITGGLEPEVLARYQSSRNATGVAAAKLANGQCFGCRLSLPPGTAAELENKPLDELENCEECGCLLVRGV